MIVVDFTKIRPMFGGKLTQEQVDNINLINSTYLTEAPAENVQELAYILGTTKWETAHIMEPVVERGGVAYFKKYDAGTKIGKRLGNTLKGDGYKFRGRGFVQLTGRRNYKLVSDNFKVDLLANPDMALEPALSAKILVRGMLKGWFTGKALKDYVDNKDESDAEELREFINARRTVNGEDRAKEIGQIALKFEKALSVSAAKAPEPIVPATPSDDTPWWLRLITAVLKALGVYRG